MRLSPSLLWRSLFGRPALRRRAAPGRARPMAVELLESREVLDASKLMVQLAAGAGIPADHWGLASNIQATPLADWYQVSGGDLGVAQKRLAADTNVARIEWSGAAKASLAPDDPLYTNNSLHGLSGPYGINAPAAWDYTTGSTTVSVGVVDTGIDVTHPDLYKNIWLNQGEIPASIAATIKADVGWDVDGDGLITFWDLNEPRNQGPGKITDLDSDGLITGKDVLYTTAQGGWADGVSNDGDDYTDDLVGWNFYSWNNRPFDDNNHGTHVAGTIGAMGDNGRGVVGVNWKVQLQALKILDSGGAGSESDGALAIYYAATHGARVSNNSWNGPFYSQFLVDAINAAGALDHLVVAAAGNSSANIDFGATYPASYPMDNIVVVAATTSGGGLASFSNYGATTVDLGAPGAHIWSTVRGGYAPFNGTSMATPHVVGAVALVMSGAPALSSMQVKDLLLGRVTSNPNLAGITVAGGVLNVAGIFTGPEIQLFDGAASVFDNAGVVSFGTSFIGSPAAKTLTIVNAGTQPLNLDTITVPAGFILVSGPATTTLTTGQSTTIIVRALAATKGTFTGTLTLNNNDESEGAFRIRLSAVVANRPPTINAIADQTISHVQDTITVGTSGSDPDGDSLTYSASAVSQAFTLRQSLGLFSSGDYSVNRGGLQEKWISGNGGAAYYLLPNGDLIKSAGSGSITGSFVANVGVALYHDPTLLTGALPVVVTTSSTGNSVTIDPPSTFVGKLIVTVIASDGTASAATPFVLNVTNLPPVIAAIPGQTMTAAQGTLAIPVMASDPEGRPLSYSATVATELYALDKQLGLMTTGNFGTNTYGRNEKWLFGPRGEADQAYFLLPDGSFYRQLVRATTNGTLITTFDPSVYQNPSLLYNAVNLAGSGSVVDGQLFVSPPALFTGKLIVTLTASDGLAAASTSFALQVTNLPPTIAPIANQSMSVGQPSLSVAFSASDPDGQSLTYSAAVATELYALDQQLGLMTTGNLGTNTYGRGEKWLFGPKGEADQAYFLLPDGSFYKQNVKATTNGTLLATFDPSVYLNPSLLYNAVNIGGSASVANGQIVVTPPARYAGKLIATLTAGDGLTTTSSSFALQVTNQAPVLAAIANQSMSVAQPQLIVSFSGSDPEGQPLSFTGAVATEMYVLDQQLGLMTTGNLGTNIFGKNEKWLFGPKGEADQAYFLLPDGSFYKQNVKGTTNGTLITTFDPSVYLNPALLYNATNIGGSASVIGGELVVTPPARYVGKLIVTLSANDGLATSSTSFALQIVNLAPVIAPISDQTMSINRPNLTVGFTASDPDGQALSFSATVGTQLYALDQQLGLTSTGNFGTNFYGKNEKWIYGPNDQAYFLLPDGSFYKQTVKATTTGTLVAMLDPAVYQSPALLYNATNVGGFVSIVGGQMVVTPPANYVGKLIVTLTASDGYASTPATFTLNVVNQPPVIAPIANAVLPSGQLTVAFDASDPDGQPLTYSVSVQTLAYILDQQLGLTTIGGFSTNALGMNEKWLYGSAGTAGPGYYILPDGSFYKQTIRGSLAGSVLLGKFDASVYANPALLYNAVNNGGTATIVGNSIVLTRAASYSGVLVVTLTASDGKATTSVTFNVS